MGLKPQNKVLLVLFSSFITVAVCQLNIPGEEGTGGLYSSYNLHGVPPQGPSGTSTLYSGYNMHGIAPHGPTGNGYLHHEPSSAGFDVHPVPQSVCTLKADPGFCNLMIGRWYYDFRYHRCVPFLYTGCGGNMNNFISQADCAHATKLCHSLDPYPPQQLIPAAVLPG